VSQQMLKNGNIKSWVGKNSTKYLQKCSWYREMVVLAINGTLHWSWYKLHFYMEGVWCIFKTWDNHTMYNNYLDLENMCFCTEMKFYGQYFTDSCTCTVHVHVSWYACTNLMHVLLFFVIWGIPSTNSESRIHLDELQVSL
jgi:hypothetical protein